MPSRVSGGTLARIAVSITADGQGTLGASPAARRDTIGAASCPGATMKYCSDCGAPVSLRIPAGDTLPRFVCERCGTIHYQNPKLVVGALAQWEDDILLCRRAIEPRHGMWTLPAGFMENAETTTQAAARETLEEACARIEVGSLFTLISVPHINQVHIVYRALLLDLDFSAGAETLEVALFSESAIPWDMIAFRSIALTLRHFYADRRNGHFALHTDDIILQPSGM